MAPRVSRSMLMQSDSPSRCPMDTALRKYPSEVPQPAQKAVRRLGGNALMYASNLSITKIYHPVCSLSTPDGNLLYTYRAKQSDMEKNADMVAQRRQRLRELIASKYAGRQAALVEQIGINQGELSGLLNKKSFGEKKARALEKQIGLPHGWLDGVDEHEAVVAEFAKVYRNATPKGREFLRIAIDGTRAAYMQHIPASVHLSIVKKDEDEAGA